MKYNFVIIKPLTDRIDKRPLPLIVVQSNDFEKAAEVLGGKITHTFTEFPYTAVIEFSLQEIEQDQRWIEQSSSKVPTEWPTGSRIFARKGYESDEYNYPFGILIFPCSKNAPLQSESLFLSGEPYLEIRWDRSYNEISFNIYKIPLG